MNRIAITVATLSLLAAPASQAARTTYTFDTITAIDLNVTDHSIIGVLQNTSTPIAIGFAERTNADYHFVVNRCVPVLLLAMEKPGRYTVSITIDPALSAGQLVSCGLQLKP